MRNLIKVGSALLFTALLAFSIHLFKVQALKSADFKSRQILANESTTVIDIADGESGYEIARNLFDKKVVASTESFYRLAVSDSRSKGISAGQHALSLHISAKQALDQLLDAKRMPGLIKVIEGQWRSEILEKMTANGFTNLTKAIPQLKLPTGFDATEGVFFPAQYSFARGTSSVVALQSMIDKFKNEAGKLGLFATKDPKANLTIASLVQAEGDPTDYAKIARVIFNRLKIGMPLQLDTTVQYVLKKRGSVYLSAKSTLINSPYNTYKHYGLPIGPIGSPGAAAIDAALHPAEGDWLFFITVKPGDTRFTKSQNEFLKWKELYLKNLKAGLFK